MFDGEGYIMQFEEFVDLVVFEGCVLDVDLASPEGQLHVLQAGDELAEVAPQY